MPLIRIYVERDLAEGATAEFEFNPDAGIPIEDALQTFLNQEGGAELDWAETDYLGDIKIADTVYRRQDPETGEWIQYELDGAICTDPDNNYHDDEDDGY